MQPATVDRGVVTIISISIFLIILPVLAVIGRFYVRITHHSQGLGLDDWTCLLALIINIFVCISVILNALGYFTGNVITAPQEDLPLKRELFFIGIYLFIVAIGLIKASVLFFYSRVFASSGRSFRWLLYLGHFMVGVWYMSELVLNSVACESLATRWQPATAQDRCVPLFTYFFISGLLDCLIDLYILLLPMPLLRRLHMRPKKKFLVAAAFILGYCCLFISIGRLITTAVGGSRLNKNLYQNGVALLLWLLFEVGLEIISICVPSLWVLFVDLKERASKAFPSSRSTGETDTTQVTSQKNPTGGECT